MEVSETLVVENPSRTTYVGEQVTDKRRETLRLSIPPEFERVTFDREFYGRRFQVVDHRPVTDIPWPPGPRELKFTYQIPLDANAGLFRRPLDLPCREIRVRVKSEDLKQVTCNLPRIADPDGRLAFATTKPDLPAGFIIELQVGKQPINWRLYARWSSLGVLSLLTFGTVTICRRRDA
jgi:hypothetical protein